MYSKRVGIRRRALGLVAANIVVLLALATYAFWPRTQQPERAQPGTASTPSKGSEVFKPIDMTTMSLKEGHAFALRDEIDVNGQLVSRLTSVWSRSPDGTWDRVKTVVLMRNKTYRSLHPNVRIEIFNRYGMALGSTSVAWVLIQSLRWGSL